MLGISDERSMPSTYVLYILTYLVHVCKNKTIRLKSRTLSPLIPGEMSGHNVRVTLHRTRRVGLDPPGDSPFYLPSDPSIFPSFITQHLHNVYLWNSLPRYHVCLLLNLPGENSSDTFSLATANRTASPLAASSTVSLPDSPSPKKTSNLSSPAAVPASPPSPPLAMRRTASPFNPALSSVIPWARQLP
jgi:hypothetical protein